MDFRQYSMSNKQLTLAALLLATLTFVDGTFLYLALGEVNDHQAAYGHLMTDPMWHTSEGPVVYFGASSVSEQSAFVAGSISQRRSFTRAPLVSI